MIFQWFNQKKRQEINGPTAAVVQYDQVNQVPVVVAQGKGALAQKIIDLAEKNHVPIQQDSTLVSNLIDMDLGENIPPQLYAVMAEIFLMIEDLEENI